MPVYTSMEAVRNGGLDGVTVTLSTYKASIVNHLETKVARRWWSSLTVFHAQFDRNYSLGTYLTNAVTLPLLYNCLPIEVSLPRLMR